MMSKRISWLDYAGAMHVNPHGRPTTVGGSRYVHGGPDWRNILDDGKPFWSADFLKNPPGDYAMCQPYTMLYELPVPEPMYYAIVDGLCGTTGLWFNYIKIKEGISISPSSASHGSILMKQSYQRKDAKEMMATIQTLKTVLLNLESDLEKLREQKLAFDNKNVEKIKGLFVDNYGGPSRNWTAIARAVPLVKTALTWFYKVKKDDKKAMLEEIDKFVKDDQLNPAVANYLKRKVEEYDDWKQSYQSFLKRTYRNIVENLRQQRANMQLYMRWAMRNIQEAENMLVPYEELKEGALSVMDEEFPQFGGKLYTVSEMFYESWSQWGIVRRVCEPWFPAFSGQTIFAYNPDLQGAKYCRGNFMLFYGAMHLQDFWKLERERTKQMTEFIGMMETRGGFNDEELRNMGVGRTAEEVSMEKYKGLQAKMKGGEALTKKEEEEFNDAAGKIGEEIFNKNEAPAKAEADFIKEMSSVFDIGPGAIRADAGHKAAKNKWWESPERVLFSKILMGAKPFFELMGSDMIDKLDTRKNRAMWMASNLFYKFLINLKKGQGMPTWEGWG